MLSVEVKRISSRKIQDQLPDYEWSESLDPLSNPHLLEWLRDQERAFQVLIYHELSKISFIKIGHPIIFSCL